MALFKRRKKDGEEYEVGERLLKKKAKKSDSQDDGPKKKKPPEKPWGKKERVMVVLLILLTVAASFYFSLKGSGWKLPKVGDIKIPPLSIPFFSEETVTIEAER